LVVKSAQDVNVGKLKRQLHAILPLTSLFVPAAPAGEVDPRVDGRWIGVETFKYRSYPYTHYIRTTTVIGIADSGKMFGVLSGFAPGRYEVSLKSSGNTLIFQAPNTKGDSLIYQGRPTVHLSALIQREHLGNTLKEDGIAILNPQSHPALSAQV
jgi:hypothetical protein